MGLLPVITALQARLIAEYKRRISKEPNINQEVALYKLDHQVHLE